MYDPNSKSGAAAVARLEANVAVVNENIVHGATNGNNLKYSNGIVLQDEVNGEESSTKVNGKVGDEKIINGEQPLKASWDMVNRNLKKDLKHDVNKERVNEDIKSNVGQD